jgi:hypothetical protein
LLNLICSVIRLEASIRVGLEAGQIDERLSRAQAVSLLLPAMTVCPPGANGTAIVFHRASIF